MEKKNLLALDLQMFADEDVDQDAGANEVSDAADQTEEEATETESEETGENSGDSEPPKQTAEENARYAEIRRRAEEDARRKYQIPSQERDQRVAAMCQGMTNPITGQPITNVDEYFDALQAQQRLANEQELQEKGVDPELIDRMITSHPVVMQANQVIEQSQRVAADAQVQRDIAELSKYDPNIKSIQDLASLPNFPQMVQYIEEKGVSLIEAYKVLNFDNFMQHTNEAARQQAINQMRGKDHLSTQKGVSQSDDEYVEVPAEIMNRMKADGKSEKDIKELFKRTIRNGLNLN